MNKLKNERAIIIDVDGSMYDSFKIDDRKIIREIFVNNNVINKIDDFLWSINSLDFLSNSISILKLRFIIYSIFGHKKYEYVIKKYEMRYKECLKKSIEDIDKNTLKKIFNKYYVIIVTNNPFSMSILRQYFKNVFYCPNAISRKNIINYHDKFLDVKYVIGNNFIDDIYSAKCINAECIYIGSSFLSKVYNANYCVNSFEKAMNVILAKH